MAKILTVKMNISFHEKPGLPLTEAQVDEIVDAISFFFDNGLPYREKIIREGSMIFDMRLKTETRERIRGE